MISVCNVVFAFFMTHLTNHVCACMMLHDVHASAREIGIANVKRFVTLHEHPKNGQQKDWPDYG